MPNYDESTTGTSSSRHNPGINSLGEGEVLGARGLFLVKTSMMIIPLVLIVISLFIYLRGYIIDEAYYKEILMKLKERADSRQNM